MARPYVADQRREEILAAFEACVVRNGIDNTTLDDVAKEAGQPRSLVRYFVGNRAELVGLLIDRIVTRSEAQLTQLHPARGPNAPAQLVDFMLEELFAEPITDKLMAELWHLSVRSEPIRARLSLMYRHVVREIAKQVSPPVKKGEDPTNFDTVLAVFSLGLGATVLKHFGLTANDPAQFVRMVRQLAEPKPIAKAKRQPRN